jgi:hypothetical protein
VVQVPISFCHILVTGNTPHEVTGILYIEHLIASELAEWVGKVLIHLTRIGEVEK